MLGKNLDALMFVVYVNDLLLVVDTGSEYGYADDFKVILQSLNEAKKIASELEKLSKGYHMKLNLDGHKILCIKRKHAVQSDINDQIPIVNCQKDLGVIISTNLS